jgi:hypothetical protein
VNLYRTIVQRKYPDCWQWLCIARRIPGQLIENEANLLFLLVRRRTPSINPLIVELGASRGKMSVLLAAGLRGKVGPRLVPLQRTGADGKRDRQILHRNLHRCRLGHIVDTTVGEPGMAAAAWKEAIDILFVNAAADDDALRSDLSLWSAFVKVDGIVILRGASPDLVESLQSHPYGEFRREETLAWAVKQCPTPIAAARVEPSASANQLRYLLNRSIEAMLHLNTIPGVLEEQAGHIDHRTEHLEEATEIAMAKMQDYVRRAARALAEDRHAVQALRRSWSWRLTAPLRLGIETLQALAGLLASFGRGSPRDRMRGLVEWVVFGRQVRASGLLDERYYRANCPDGGWARSSPLLHFLVTGASEGNNPNELFNVRYYLRRYPDIARARVNPLIHYLRTGAYEGRDPHPYFDSSFYLEQYPDVRESRLNPLAHYLAPGIAEGRDPNPWFNTSQYLEQNPAVAGFGLNPLVHHFEETHPR